MLRISSGNTFKTRLALNLKGLPFETKWLDHPDIAPTLSGLGTAANKDGGTPYTCPAVSTPSHPVPVMESWTIAEFLDETYPEAPSKLFPGPGAKPLARAVRSYADVVIGPLIQPITIPRVYLILTERGKAYFKSSREKRLGMSIEEYVKANTDIPKFVKAWEVFDQMLGDDEEGPFLMGKLPSYGDIIIVGLLAMYSVIDADILQQLLSVGEGRLDTLWKACQKWL